MKYLGDYIEDGSVIIFFTTNDAAGAAVAPSSAFEAADVKIYKDSSDTEKTTTNGLTMTSPFDSIVGLHQLIINTATDTGDTGFWEDGHDYTVILSPDETVDGQTIVAVLGQFSIENRRFSAANLANIADTVMRRHQATIEASSTGESLDKDSLYGMIQAILKWSLLGTTLTIKKTDGTTLGTKTVAYDAGANPITGVS